MSEFQKLLNEKIKEKLIQSDKYWACAGCKSIIRKDIVSCPVCGGLKHENNL